MATVAGLEWWRSCPFVPFAIQSRKASAEKRHMTIVNVRACCASHKRWCDAKTSWKYRNCVGDRLVMADNELLLQFHTVSEIQKMKQPQKKKTLKDEVIERTVSNSKYLKLNINEQPWLTIAVHTFYSTGYDSYTVHTLANWLNRVGFFFFQIINRCANFNFEKY